MERAKGEGRDGCGVGTSPQDYAAFLALCDMFDGVMSPEELAASPGLTSALDTLGLLYASVRAYGEAGGMIVPEGYDYLLGLYRNLYDAHGTLPDEIDRQDPAWLFEVLTKKQEQPVDESMIPGGY